MKDTAADEFDSQGNGDYFTDDLLMINRYAYMQAKMTAKAKGLKTYLVALDKYASGEIKKEISLTDKS
jgi:hypothetical protein